MNFLTFSILCVPILAYILSPFSGLLGQNTLAFSLDHSKMWTFFEAVLQL